MNEDREFKITINMLKWFTLYIILVLIVSNIVFIRNVSAYRPEPIEITDMIEDGMIRFDDPGYTRFNGLTYTDGDEPLYRAYLEFNISSVPSNAIIDKVEIRYMTETPAGNQSIYSMENQPSSTADGTVYADCHDGTMYVKVSGQSAETWYTQDLGSSAVSDFQTRVDNTDGWFAIGRYGGEEDSEWYSVETANDPILYVYYHISGDVVYNIDGLYYENGTKSGAVNATAHFTNTTITFEVDGNQTYHFQDEPMLFAWNIEVGNSRRIYTPTAPETLILFTPEDTYSTYAFTIKDYTGGLGEGDGYLEAYRFINASDRLIERMIIQDTHNAIPMKLVVDQIYRFKVLFSDSSVYDLGYFMFPESTYTFVLSEMNFTDQAQTVYQYITAEATRPTPTKLRLVYNDTTPGFDTQRVNFTVEYRNGTQAYNSSVASSNNVAFNWNSADNETDYVVRMWVDHEYHGELEQGWVLDYSRTFQSFPDFDILGTWPFPSTNLLALFLAIIVMGVFSFKTAPIAPFMGMVIIGSFTYLGGATFTDTQIGIGFSLSLLLGLGIWGSS